MTTPVSRELALLRSSEDRVLEREGIPMVLALVSEVTDMAEVADPVVRADGTQLAERMDHVADAVWPSGRDDDMPRVVMVMQATAYADFGTDLLL